MSLLCIVLLLLAMMRIRGFFPTIVRSFARAVSGIGLLYLRLLRRHDHTILLWCMVQS